MMSDNYILTFRPAGVRLYSGHDPSAAIFKNNELIFAAEEERYTRIKKARNQFPKNAIAACLSHCNIAISDVDKIIMGWDIKLGSKKFDYQLKKSLLHHKGILPKLFHTERTLEKQAIAKFRPLNEIREELRTFGEPLPPIQSKSHHYCHAASAFHPSGFDEALVITMDAAGEFDSTVVWKGNENGLNRIQTYEYPNSLGRFYGIVTEFLGYNRTKGAGKVMGLAPYGSYNDRIHKKLSENVETSWDYDVTSITQYGVEYGVDKLTEILGKSPSDSTDSFSQWEKDLAYTTQSILEDIATNLVDHYAGSTESVSVCLAGGVALNCKMNKKILELQSVDELFVQPVANDAGVALGAGYSETNPKNIEEMNHVYYGDEFRSGSIRELLNKNKISFEVPDDLGAEIASAIAEGNIIGWFNGRMELGPRALGNRSILADPRSDESRDRVNKYVKHREEWRPFAPSILEDRAEDYLQNYTDAPFMVKTFDVRDEKKSEIPAVLHPGDNTTRPQVVKKETNPEYYNLISEFENITGVPVLLNTSFNDHGEPIVRTPKDAIRSFYGMGLDILVLNDIVIEKNNY